MAVIHKTTLVPGKLALLKSWLPAQPWYLASGREPELVRAGGFRLDDPDGEVGIEFAVVTDTSGGEAVAYQVPLTYRGSACADAGDGLIGTAAHGVLGRRWIYDGTHDQVLVAQLAALIQGRAQAQAQSESNTPDPTVDSQPVMGTSLDVTGSSVAANGPGGTDLRITAADATGTMAGHLLVRVVRVLRPGGSPGVAAGWQPCLAAAWRLPDGIQVRGTFAAARRQA